MDLIKKTKSWFIKKKSQNRQTTSLTWSQKKGGKYNKIKNDNGEIILKQKQNLKKLLQ